MKFSKGAQRILREVEDNIKLGDIRKIAKSIQRNHALAMELWFSAGFKPRMLAILILDKKQLNQNLIDQFVQDMQNHPYEERIQLIDWLMANQLTKDKKLIELIETWAKSASSLQRRIFWYYQARLRWMGNTDFVNTTDLLTAIEERILSEPPEVQWAMNYTAGQIGKWQEEFRDRCIAIGLTTGLYKDEKVAKNCTPNYLPEFIRMEVEKLNK